MTELKKASALEIDNLNTGSEVTVEGISTEVDPNLSDTGRKLEGNSKHIESESKLTGVEINTSPQASETVLTNSQDINNLENPTPEDLKKKLMDILEGHSSEYDEVTKKLTGV